VAPFDRVQCSVRANVRPGSRSQTSGFSSISRRSGYAYLRLIGVKDNHSCNDRAFLRHHRAIARFDNGPMAILAHFCVGRILLHLLAMLGDRCVRFHVAGIMREFPSAAPALTLLARMRARVIGALALYLAQPVGRASAATIADLQSLAAILDRGDVLLSDSNTRVAALVRLVTRSTWSHVAMYVGPRVCAGRTPDPAGPGAGQSGRRGGRQKPHAGRFRARGALRGGRMMNTYLEVTSRFSPDRSGFVSSPNRWRMLGLRLRHRAASRRAAGRSRTCCPARARSSRRSRQPGRPRSRQPATGRDPYPGRLPWW
jgi:hypothetical protein